MRPSTSFFLDGLRVVAALVVFVVHCIYFWDRRDFAVAGHWAHAAVVVFFVLSGYVIAYATLGRPQSARGYVVARLSRLYSVLVPALVLTALLQAGWQAFDPGGSPVPSRGYEVLRYGLVAINLQSVWTVFASPSANLPFWSLSYEFWYYAMFGAAVLLRPGRARMLGGLVTALIAGPDILLLLPCWLAGVTAYLGRERTLGGVVAARAGFFVSLAASGAVMGWMPEWPGHFGQPPWWFSSMFVTDWTLALGVAATILCFNAARFPGPPRWMWTGVRWGAGHTFSLYLFHFPLLAFITVVCRLRQPPVWQAALAAGGTLLAVVALSTFTEAKRAVWQRGFAQGWDALIRPARGIV